MLDVDAISRARRTEARVRAMDAVDIVAEIHALQDAREAMLAALRALLDLREGTDMDFESAYRAMFKSDGNSAWDAAIAAIAKAEG